MGKTSGLIRLDSEIQKMINYKGNLYTISNLNEVNIISTNPIEIVRKVKFEDQILTTIYCNDEYFMYGDQFNHLYLIKHEDLEKDKINKKNLAGHDSWILDIIDDEKYIYTCSDDKKVLVWDKKYREF